MGGRGLGSRRWRGRDAVLASGVEELGSERRVCQRAREITQSLRPFPFTGVLVLYKNPNNLSISNLTN